MPGIDSSIFVDDVEEFTCPICFEVFEDPVTACTNNHHFCYKCYRECSTRSNLCPTCRLPFLRPVFDQILSLVINSLRRKCSNYDKGCEDWVGNDSELENHLLTTCGYEKVPCPNILQGCKILLLRKDTSNHIEACKYIPKPCPRSNNCGAFANSRQLAQHAQVCQHFRCCNKDEGCNFRGTLTDKRKHEPVCIGLVTTFNKKNRALSIRISALEIERNMTADLERQVVEQRKEIRMHRQRLQDQERRHEESVRKLEREKDAVILQLKKELEGKIESSHLIRFVSRPEIFHGPSNDTTTPNGSGNSALQDSSHQNLVPPSNCKVTPMKRLRSTENKESDTRADDQENLTNNELEIGATSEPLTSLSNRQSIMYLGEGRGSKENPLTLDGPSGLGRSKRKKCVHCSGGIVVERENRIVIDLD